MALPNHLQTPFECWGVLPSLSWRRQELDGKGRAQPRPRFPPCTPLEGQALVLTAGGLWAGAWDTPLPAPAGSTARRWEVLVLRRGNLGPRPQRTSLARAGHPGGWHSFLPWCAVWIWGVPPFATSRWWAGPHSDWVLVAGEAAELLLQGLEAGPLLGVPVPAREHQPVGTGWALGGTGHAVARLHPREGLVVGHACGEGDRAAGDQCPPATVPPGTPWPRSHPLHLPRPFLGPSL